MAEVRTVAELQKELHRVIPRAGASAEGIREADALIFQLAAIAKRAEQIEDTRDAYARGVEAGQRSIREARDSAKRDAARWRFVCEDGNTYSVRRLEVSGRKAMWVEVTLDEIDAAIAAKEQRHG